MLEQERQFQGVDMSLAPIYVVILNWNLKHETIACVESVLAAGMTMEQIVVVDNGSVDDSVVSLAARFGPALSLICSEKNQGFAGGMNLGIRAALDRGAASVLLLSNDTVIDHAMIEVVLAAGETLDNPDILGPAIYYYDDPERLWALGGVWHRWLPMPTAIWLDKRGLSNSAPFRVDHVTGCAMLVRREVFEHIGLFDTRYYAYYEDADFCRRAKDAGFTAWVVPQAKMRHKVSLTTQRDKPLYHYLRARNQIRFYRKYVHGPPAVLREGYIVVKLIMVMFSDVWHGDWNLIGPLWRGSVDGYRAQWVQGAADTGSTRSR